MKQNADMLLAFSKELADASGALIRRYFRADYAVELKADESPVTVADRGAEELMRRMIMERFPDHGILGEEFGRYQPDAEYQWVLDPIDGTKSFISHTYLFGTLIALLHHGKPILGVINNPVVNDFLVGMGGKSWLNGRQVQVRTCNRLEDAVLSCTNHWNVFNYHNGAAFEGLTRQVKRYHNWGDCHGYHLVASAGIDVMLDAILEVWDLMALIPIIEGAGGVITDWAGNNAIGGNGVVATGRGIHEQVIRALNP
jgi:histidinol phosphatase-like enzyme (inositol monophosphatase family)